MAIDAKTYLKALAKADTRRRELQKPLRPEECLERVENLYNLALGMGWLPKLQEEDWQEHLDWNRIREKLLERAK